MSRLVLFAVTATALACGPATPPSGIDPKLSVIQAKVFQQGGCTGCHYNDSANGKLDLMVGKSFAALVDKESRMPTTWAGTEWAGKKLVVPGDPENSLLIVTLEHHAGIPEVMKMPQGGTKLPADRINAVRQWIEDGALDN